SATQGKVEGCCIAGGDGIACPGIAERESVEVGSLSGGADGSDGDFHAVFSGGIGRSRSDYRQTAVVPNSDGRARDGTIVDVADSSGQDTGVEADTDQRGSRAPWPNIINSVVCTDTEGVVMACTQTIR